jgi:hypothetical protein
MTFLSGCRRPSHRARDGFTQAVARGAAGVDETGTRLDSTTPLETAYRVSVAML